MIEPDRMRRRTGTYAEDVTDGKQLTFDFGDVTVNSFTLTSGGAGTVLDGNLTATGAIALNAAATVDGDITAASFTSNGALTFAGDLTATGAIVLNAAATVDGDIKGASFTSNGALTFAGDLTAGSIAMKRAVTLTGDTTLTTTGALTVASVTGAGNDLTLDAGGNTSLGNVSGVGALGVDGKSTLTGTSYAANSETFGGDVTLTAANTTLDTSIDGGDITFNGDIFGTTDGGQSLTLIAGAGTGSAAANGDITLQNAGTQSVRLNDMTVSGNDFTALTVWLADSYSSTLTGNQVFAADTLHAGGDVNSTVGGDASGHIVADGDVTIVADGDVSGTIGGQNVNLKGDDVNSQVTASKNVSVTGNTVEGSYAGDNVALTANTVDAGVDANTVSLVSNGGSVTGNWTSIQTVGSGVVYVNGEPQINANPAQLVVEGFTLPAGTTIGANGQLILPQGVLLGLLSPGGGKPKMILVHSVQQLGQLLASGYSVIVIDLSNRGEDKPVQLASN
jgi:cytoskeletal protein CcmA (bactofilin family)